MREIELLAPAQNYDAARAAVDHGADALYMGASKFGARAAACNSIEQIARTAEYAHQYGVKLYATLNTLIFEDELEAAEREAREVVSAGVDALIIQDLAYARMGLDVELHSSTQMCNITPDQVRFLGDLGFSRVVLERNLSLKEIAKIARESSVELEAFIHGAICVGFSGRCYLSRSMSSRSGNRGECSQPCRMCYDLIDSAGRKILESKHLLSVKDFNLTDRVADLLDAGVNSLKIEGRLKEINYTKNVVAHYRRVIDGVIARRDDMVRASSGRTTIEFEPNPAKSFSRSETKYMIDGREREVASLESPKALGEVVGIVGEKRGNKLYIEGRKSIATGDGLCFFTKEGLAGSNVNRVEDGWVTLNKAVGIGLGAKVFRNFDRLFESSVENSRTRRTIAVEAAITSNSGRVEVSYRDADGYSAKASMEGDFEQSKSREKMADVIVTQLAKCGESIFEMRGKRCVDLSGWGGEFVASSQLSQLRRDALQSLVERRIEGAAERRGSAFVEGLGAKFPTTDVAAEMSVTNSLARALLMDHGVTYIADSLELKDDFTDAKVLESAYCIRREIGECLKRGSRVRGDLYIERGAHRYRLNFNCSRCRMSLIKVDKKAL